MTFFQKHQETQGRALHLVRYVLAITHCNIRLLLKLLFFAKLCAKFFHPYVKWVIHISHSFECNVVHFRFCSSTLKCNYHIKYIPLDEKSNYLSFYIKSSYRCLPLNGVSVSKRHSRNVSIKFRLDQSPNQLPFLSHLHVVTWLRRYISG